MEETGFDQNTLIRNILSGDMIAFKGLVEQYRDKVISICYGFTRQNEDAEDLAQEVFIEVFESLQRFRSEAKLSTWIYRIAVNKSLNHLRKMKKLKTTITIDVSSESLNSGIDDVPAGEAADDAFLNIEKRKMLDQALNKLSDSQKTAFTLNKIEGFSYKEIAATMNISLAATESLIHRSRRNLQKALVNYYQKKD